MAMPSLCGETGECVCITWISGGSGTVEVRCPANGGTPSGWAISGNPGDADGSRGSFGGPGNKTTAPSPLPGMPLNPTTAQKLSSAKSAAIQKLKGDQEYDDGTGKPIWTPTACTDLFLNSPLSTASNPTPGAQLLGSYVVFRDGTGHRDANGIDQCAAGVAAWTTCCRHDPIVFICPGKFNGASIDDRVKYLIHETLHVAGQMEDGDGTVGPGDPPNSDQINADVDAACNSN
jgi:hypothetical protein